jgi:hypothetical protein
MAKFLVVLMNIVLTSCFNDSNNNGKSGVHPTVLEASFYAYGSEIPNTTFYISNSLFYEITIKDTDLDAKSMIVERYITADGSNYNQETIHLSKQISEEMICVDPDGTYWNVLGPAGNYTIVITVIDSAGNVSDTFNVNLLINL